MRRQPKDEGVTVWDAYGGTLPSPVRSQATEAALTECAEQHRLATKEREELRIRAHSATERIRELENALDDALAWIVNKWEWDQNHYNELSAIRKGHKPGTSAPESPSGGE